MQIMLHYFFGKVATAASHSSIGKWIKSHQAQPVAELFVFALEMKNEDKHGKFRLPW